MSMSQPFSESGFFFTGQSAARQQGTTFSGSRETTVRMERETVLVVDDDQVVRKYIAMTLRKAGYEVVEAEDGEAALGVISDREIDLVVSDVIMPRMNGMELYRAIKKVRPELHVIFASGYSSDILSSSEIEREDLRFLQKPVLKVTLLDAVREALELQYL